jgi:hypothetical protein
MATDSIDVTPMTPGALRSCHPFHSRLFPAPEYKHDAAYVYPVRVSDLNSI